MKAMILAAGRGTRLGSLTEKLPKPMFLLDNKPLLEYNIVHLVSCGFDEIVVNIHYLAGIIEDFVGDGSQFGASVTCVRQEKPLGTAGAVKNVEDFFDDEPFLVLYGDLLTNQDFSELLALHREKEATATIALHQRANSNSLVQLETDGRVSGFIERPSEEQRAANPFPWVNSGIQVLEKEALAGLQKGEPADLPRDVYPELVEAGSLYALPLLGDRVAIDSPERYEQAKALVKNW